MTRHDVVIVRQGDVLLVRVDALPEDARPEQVDSQRVVLAEGEATGHAHVVQSPRASLYRSDAWEQRFLVVTGRQPTLLRHEEHNPLEVGPGVWEIRQQREYVPGGEERWAAD